MSSKIGLVRVKAIRWWKICLPRTVGRKRRAVRREPMYGSLPINKIEGGRASSSSSSSLDPQDDDPAGDEVETGTVRSGALSLANTIIGSGTLGLPGAFAGTGWATGLLLLVLAAAMSANGLFLLARASVKAGLPGSFRSVGRRAVPGAEGLVDLAVAVKCFGVATGYLVSLVFDLSLTCHHASIKFLTPLKLTSKPFHRTMQITISDSMVGAFDHLLLPSDDSDPGPLATLLLSRRVWVVGAAAAVLPLSFHRTLDALKRASALALVFVACLVAVVLSFATGTLDPCGGRDADECRGSVEATTDAHSTLASLPVFVFAFTCHQNVFPVVNEMGPPDKLRKADAAVVVAVTTSLVVFGLVSLGGYSTFGSFTQGDVLLNYPRTGPVTALRLCVAAMLVLHYPLQLDPSRRCVVSLVEAVGEWRNGRRLDSEVSGDDDEEFEGYSKVEDGPEAEDRRAASTTEGDEITGRDDLLFRRTTVAFLVLSVALALAVDDLGVVLALVGATGSAVVSYVLPGIVYLRICDGRSVPAWTQLVAGLWVMPVALYHVLGRMGR